MAMSEDAEAERVARWLEHDADLAHEGMMHARKHGWHDNASDYEARERLARKFARHIREGKHREK